MAITFRSKTEVTLATTTDTTINKPTSVSEGDILIACLSINTGTAVTAPAGWTEYSISPTLAFAYDNHIYWKRASSEGSSWTWTHSSASNYAIVLSYYNCIQSGDPNDATITTNTGLGNKNCVGLSITTLTNNSLAVMLWTNNINTGGQTPPSGYTEHGGPNNTWGAVDKISELAGSTGNQTEVFVNNDNWVTFFIALKTGVHDVFGAAGSVSCSQSSGRVSEGFRG